jgi:hypothetical protein
VSAIAQGSPERSNLLTELRLLSSKTGFVVADTVHECAPPFLLDGPFLKVHGSGERREQHELRERHVGALSERHGGVEAVPGMAVRGLRRGVESRSLPVCVRR